MTKDNGSDRRRWRRWDSQGAYERARALLAESGIELPSAEGPTATPSQIERDRHDEVFQQLVERHE